VLKRGFDIVFSFVALLVTLPFWICIAILIKWSSPGPVLYIQHRVGRNGHLFNVYKFRTMYVNADREGLLTTNSAELRITTFGRFLRKLKIDEWPQFLNVLLGDMSMVGPRPEVAYFVKFYNAEQLKVLSVRPGITDFASIKYFDENDLLANSLNPEQTYLQSIMPDKLKLNLEYINSRSFFGDLKILFKTFQKLVK
jgi:lipopolysaccharide/colanic/teichoic acid biosynthesis glycosyltransferase